MAELLRDSVSKDKNAEMGQMTAAPNPDIYLETMEEAENQIEKPCEAGRAGILRPYGPFDRKDDDEPPTGQIQQSRSDPESGVFHRSEHKKRFA